MSTKVGRLRGACKLGRIRPHRVLRRFKLLRGASKLGRIRPHRVLRRFELVYRTASISKKCPFIIYFRERKRPSLSLVSFKKWELSGFSLFPSPNVGGFGDENRDKPRISNFWRGLAGEHVVNTPKNSAQHCGSSYQYSLIGIRNTSLNF
jgi:hypothetical protein